MTAALGIALRNALLYEETYERARTNEAVNQITAAINAGHGLPETARIITEQFNRLFSFDHISISLLDDSKEKVKQWIFGEQGSFEQKQIIPLKESRLAQTIQSGQGYIEDDIFGLKPDNKTYPDEQILLTDQIKSNITVLLTTQTKPYGSFTLGSRYAGAYAPNHLKLLEQLAPQIAIAIEKALLIDAMEQRATELHLLNRLGEMLVSTTNINVIVDTTLNMLPRLLPGDVQGVIVTTEEGAHIGVAVPFGFEKEDEIIKLICDTFLEIQEDGDAVDLVSSKIIPGNMPVSANWEPVSVSPLPILTSRGTQGLIYVASGKEGPLDDALFRIFSLIVSQISAAVENIHLFQQVEQERARLAAILASSTDAVLVVNRNGRIVLDNPAAWDIIGSQESKSGCLLSQSTNSEALINLFQNVMHGGDTTGEIQLYDGRTFFANLSPVSVGKSGAIGWVATMQDVSHFKELNQLKNDFVNSVSHDLRSPLGSIMIAGSLIGQTGEVNDSQQELLTLIEGRVQAMRQLIDDLLDVGRIEADIEMEMGPCNLTPIIDEVLADFTPEAIDKDTLLTTDAENQDLPLVMANITRLRQAIHNLVGNALKYTPTGGKVVIKAYAQDDELRIQVADTGIGIPAGDQPHIFEKFYRVQGEHTIEIKGTGLGLSIVKGIVEKHNGRIWLESIFGEGSTFTIALPINKEADK